MADHNVQTFYNTIAQTTPMLLGYQFLVTLTPGANGELKGVNWERLQLLCQSAQLPAKVIQKTEINYFGKNFHVPTTETPQHQWQTKIILTNNMDSYNELRKLMLQFSSLERNMGGIRTIPNLDIMVDVLNQFSEVDKTQPRIILKGAYPTNLQDIPLAYQENANIIRPNVTFTYQYSYYDMAHDKNNTDSLNPGNVAPVVKE